MLCYLCTLQWLGVFDELLSLTGHGYRLSIGCLNIFLSKERICVRYKMHRQCAIDSNAYQTIFRTEDLFILYKPH